MREKDVFEERKGSCPKSFFWDSEPFLLVEREIKENELQRPFSIAPDFIVISVNPLDDKGVPGFQLAYQPLAAWAFEVLTRLFLHGDVSLRHPELSHGDDLSVLVLLGDTDENLDQIRAEEGKAAVPSMGNSRHALILFTFPLLALQIFRLSSS